VARLERPDAAGRQLGRREVALSDCSFSDNTHFYEYVRYDEPGGFHVVHVWRYEAHAYALVMRNTGKIYTIAGLPVWSPKTGSQSGHALQCPRLQTRLG